MSLHVAAISIELELPSCHTLKDKRGSLKALLAALHNEFHCSGAEIARLDDPGFSVIGCAVISNDGRQAQRVVQKIPAWIERHRPDVTVVDFALEMR